MVCNQEISNYVSKTSSCSMFEETWLTHWLKSGPACLLDFSYQSSLSKTYSVIRQRSVSFVFTAISQLYQNCLPLDISLSHILHTYKGYSVKLIQQRSAPSIKIENKIGKSQAMSAQPPLHPLFSSVKHQYLGCDLCSDSMYDSEYSEQTSWCVNNF